MGHVRIREKNRGWILEDDRGFSLSEVKFVIREMKDNNAPRIEDISTRTFKRLLHVLEI